MKHRDLKIKNKYYSLVSRWLLVLQIFVCGPAISSDLKTESATLKYQLSGDASAGLSFPSDVTSNAKQIIVVDGGNHRVVVFDKQGKHLFSFGSYGSAPGQFNYPVGVFATNKKIYVADSGNHRVQIFNNKGKFINSFPVRRKNKPVRPIDLIVHSRSENIMVTASEAHSIMIFSAGGKEIDQWGGNGMNQGEFRYPATITELADGRVAVVDVLNTRVQVFNTNGTISLVVGDWGVLEGQLVRPKGVAIDKKGQFYVSDSYMNLVQVFSDTGKFVAVLGKNAKPFNMTTPVGMQVDNNMLYVVEMRKHRVSVYQLRN